MSELKSYDLVDIQDYRGEVYIKSEADKCILKLKADLVRCENYAHLGHSEFLRELNHHKYKRCLDKAERCEWERRFWTNSVLSGEEVNLQWAKWAEKWRKHWLKLAEKLKPNN